MPVPLCEQCEELELEECVIDDECAGYRCPGGCGGAGVDALISVARYKQMRAALNSSVGKDENQDEDDEDANDDAQRGEIRQAATDGRR